MQDHGYTISGGGCKGQDTGSWIYRILHPESKILYVGSWIQNPGSTGNKLACVLIARWHELGGTSIYPGSSAYPGMIHDPGPRSLYPGSWIQYNMPGSCIQEPGSRILDPVSVILHAGFCIKRPGSWIQDPGSSLHLRLR